MSAEPTLTALVANVIAARSECERLYHADYDGKKPPYHIDMGGVRSAAARFLSVAEKRLIDHMLRHADEWAERERLERAVVEAHRRCEAHPSPDLYDNLERAEGELLDHLVRHAESEDR